MSQIEKLIKWAERTDCFHEGNRNTFITRLTWAARRENIEKQELESVLVRRYSMPDFTAKEISTTIESIYKRSAKAYKPLSNSKNNNNMSQSEAKKEKQFIFHKRQQIDTAQILKRVVSKATCSSNEIVMNTSVMSFLTDIMTGAVEKQISTIRQTEDKTARNELKKGLIAIMFSGEFAKRDSQSITKASGLYCLDFDNLPKDQMETLRALLKDDPYVLSFFLSPSGNGLKVIISIPTPKTPEIHSRWFEPISAYFKTVYYCEPDKSCKDISRLCFISHDPELYINDKPAYVFEAEEKKEPQTSTTSEVTPHENQQKTFLEKDFNDLIAFVRCFFCINKLKEVRLFDKSAEIDNRLKSLAAEYKEKEGKIKKIVMI